MRLNFRQGLISFQVDTGTPVYLQESTTSGFVSHVVSPTPTVATVAHGGSDYLLKFDNTVDLAWNITAPVTTYLYWDIDQLTAAVTRGTTTLIPVNSLTAPPFPANDQHWFDLTENVTKVWSQAKAKWIIKIRLFAGSVIGGNTSVIQMYSAGSQINLNTPSNPGYILVDNMLKPLKKSTANGEFLTDDDEARVLSTVGTAGVLVQPVSRVVPVRAGESIPAMSLVYFSAADTVRLASSDPGLMPSRPPVGIMMDALTSGEVGTLVQMGEISHDQWDWSASPGAPLYCDSFGQLTLTRPPGLMAWRAGYVKNANTILLLVDSETNPQVYTAGTEQLIIAGQTPVTVTDVVNGLGERVVTISVPDVTIFQRGLMTAAQLVQLNDHETRIDTAELDIIDLQTNKSNVGHAHVIADVTGLQTELTDLENALNGKADKAIPATIGNFAALNATGNLIDSTYRPTSFALASHTHAIGDVSGLQTAIDQKAYRAHLTAISEIYTSVDRTGMFDVGTAPTLTTILAGKSNVGHTHVIADTTGLQTALNSKSDVGHGHAIADVTGLQTELNNRAFVTHTHTISNVTGLQTALDGKVAKAGDTMTGDLLLPANFVLSAGFSTINTVSGADGYVYLTRTAPGPDVSGQIAFYGADNGSRAAIGRVGTDLAIRYAAADNQFDNRISIGNSAGPGNGVGLFTPVIALDSIGRIQLAGNAGTAGQVLTSQGSGLPAQWAAGGGGGGGGLTLADAYQTRQFDVTSPFDQGNLVYSGTDAFVTTTGTVTAGTTLVFDPSGSANYSITFSGQSPVSAGFSLEFTVARQPGGAGANFDVGLRVGSFGFPDILFAYSQLHPLPFYQDRVRINDFGFEVFTQQGMNWFPTDTTAVTFKLVVLGTSLSIYVNTVLFATATIVDRSAAATRVLTLDINGGGSASSGWGPGSPGSLATTFSALNLDGSPVAPVEYPVTSSDTLVTSNLKLSAAPGSVILDQQSLQVTDNGDMLFTYPLQVDLNLTPSIKFGDGFFIERDGFAGEQITVHANTIECYSYEFVGA